LVQVQCHIEMLPWLLSTHQSYNIYILHFKASNVSPIEERFIMYVLQCMYWLFIAAYTPSLLYFALYNSKYYKKQSTGESLMWPLRFPIVHQLTVMFQRYNL